MDVVERSDLHNLPTLWAMTQLEFSQFLQGVIPSVAVFQAERGISLKPSWREIPRRAGEDARLRDDAYFVVTKNSDKCLVLCCEFQLASLE